MSEKRFFSYGLGTTIVFILTATMVVLIVLTIIGTIPVWAGATFAPLCYVFILITGFNTTEKKYMYNSSSEPRSKGTNPVLGIIGLNMAI